MISKSGYRFSERSYSPKEAASPKLESCRGLQGAIVPAAILRDALAALGLLRMTSVEEMVGARRDLRHDRSSVIAGLDPAIHPLRKMLLRRGWTRGSSPRVTPGNG